jgi:hypothetical protein
MDVSEQIIELLSPYMSIVMGLIVSLLLKDLAASLAKGIAFRFDPMFEEGDTVLLDDELAIIVKIGFRNTIFGITKPNGNYVWRYIANERVSCQKLEKILKEHKENQ